MKQLNFWSFTAALAGFLFGFDTVVISGVEQTLQQLWHTSNALHGSVVIAMALWGTVAGALLGGIPSNRLGRQKSLLWIGIFYSISALGSALSHDPYTFAFFRFLGGLGVGASTIAAPAYISEIAPANKRGRYVGLYQFNIVFGILIAFVSNYALSGLGENAWRYMVGIEAIPALIFTLFSLSLPESPRWLFLKGKTDFAKEIFNKIYTPKETHNLLDEIRLELKQSPRDESIFAVKYRFMLSLAFFIAFFNQFSGINAFLYYAPRIFEIGGLGASTALLSSVGIGIVNLVATLAGIYLIDRLGRKTLLYIGSLGYILSLSLISASFIFSWEGLFLPIFLFLFIASHAIGQGAVIWVFISEIFPTHLRSKGQVFGTSTHWVLAAIIPSLVIVLFSTIGPGAVFGFFAFMMLLQLIFVYLYMPETKGVSLEILSQSLIKSSSRQV